MKHKTKKTFEEMYEIINQVVKKRKAKWKLKAIVWFDFEDIEQIIKIHIHKSYLGQRLGPPSLEFYLFFLVKDSQRFCMQGPANP